MLILLAASCEQAASEMLETPTYAAERPLPFVPPEVVARPAHIELKTGLVIDTLVPGTGPLAKVGDHVTVHYEMRLQDQEEVLESTYKSGIPRRIRLGAGAVIRGLDRALVGARNGDELRLRVPADLAYGSKGLGSVPPDADLTLEVRVVNIEGE